MAQLFYAGSEPAASHHVYIGGAFPAEDCGAVYCMEMDAVTGRISPAGSHTASTPRYNTQIPLHLMQVISNSL
jgi:hypothetical protein